MRSITEQVAGTYRIEGDPVQSVHWEAEAAQRLRFECLTRALGHRPDESFSVLDAGCGLGAFQPFLTSRFPRARYVGTDVVAPFVESCRQQYPRSEFHLQDMLAIGGEFDYAVVSGAFNEIPPGVTPEAFTAWIAERVEHLFTLSRCALVMNFIADIGLRWHNPKNYYASPAFYPRAGGASLPLLHAVARLSAVRDDDRDPQARLRAGPQRRGRGLALMRVVIMQPYYLPYRGYFDLLARADLFVVYDDVQYRHRFWQSRNRLTVDGQPWWMTVPVLTSGRRTQLIREVRIAPGAWWRSHLGQIRRAYGSAPYFSRVYQRLEAVLEASSESLLDLNLDLMDLMFELVGASKPRRVLSSSLGIPNTGRTEREVDICRQLGADEYLSGLAAKVYMKPELWAQAGIRLGWHVPELPAYSSPACDPYASILDLAFWEGDGGYRFVAGRIDWEAPESDPWSLASSAQGSTPSRARAPG